MRPPEQDLASRRPVWAALSDLYLDTELSAGDLERVAGKLAASPYSAGDLRYILLAEVHPVCATNLLSVAGVWTGFDADWLQAAILRRRTRWHWPARLMPHRRAILAMAAPLFARAMSLRNAR